MLAIRSVPLLIAGALPAQARWTVDAANGPGTDFTSIAVALADARVVDGDVLGVRPGTYDPIETAKGVSIVGGTGVVIAVTSLHAARAAVTVRGLPAGRTFTMAGVAIEHDCTFSRAGILVQDTSGRVHFEDVHTRGVGYPNWLIGVCEAVSLDAAALVTWNRGTVRNAGGITALRSRLALTAVAADGLNGSDLGLRIIPCTPALKVWSSEVWLAQTDLRGGSGNGRGTSCPGLLSALITVPGAIALAGSGANVVSAGANVAGLPTPVIRLEGATLVYDPAVTLIAFQGSPPIVGSGTIVARALAFTSAAGAPPAGTARAAVTSSPGDPILLALSVPTLPQPTPLGPLFLDLTTMVPLFAGIQNGTGTTAIPIPVPAVPGLSGLALAVQAAHADSARNVVSLTQPSLFVIQL